MHVITNWLRDYDEAAKAHQEASQDARRRGSLNEARDPLEPGTGQHRAHRPESGARQKEIAARLEAGFLASAAQGHSSAEAAAEFERCLELIGPDPTPELYATLNALWVYYTARGDLRRGTQLAETLKAKIGSSPKLKHGTAATMGVLAGFRGDFDAARDALEQAVGGVEDGSLSETTYYGPNDPIGGTYSFLAFTRFVQGDLRGAEAALKKMEMRSHAVGFPRGAFSLCYGRSIDALIRAEAGEPERCVEVAAELSSLARHYDFDEWVMVGWSEESVGRALLALAAGESDPAALAPHVKAMTTVVRTWRAFEVKTFLAFYDGVLARVLTAAGDRQAARDCLDVALKMGHDTWIQFYDAELFACGRTHSMTRSARHRHFRDAIELSPETGCPHLRTAFGRRRLRARGGAGASGLGRGLRSHAHRPDVAGPGRAREHCSGDEGSRSSGHPRWRHGWTERCVASERAGLAGPVRIDHRLSARLASWRQRGIEPRAARSHRGARPARLARLLRQRVCAASRVLRRT